MKESTKEDLANHFGHESYADGGNVVGVATAMVYVGKLLRSEIRRPVSFEPNETAPVETPFGSDWQASSTDKSGMQERHEGPPVEIQEVHVDVVAKQPLPLLNLNRAAKSR